MLVYIIFFIVLLGFSVFDFYKGNIQIKKYIYYFYLLLIILFIGGRNECDNDFYNYTVFFEHTPALNEMTFNKLKEIYLKYQVEPIFFISSSFFKMIGLRPQSIFFFYTICTYVVMSNFILKVSSFPFMSLFLYTTCYFTLPFVQMRFGLSVGCCLYGITKLEENDYKGYWGWQILGILCHFTAFVGILYYFVRNVSIRKKYIYMILLCSFIFIFFPIRQIFTFFINMVGLGRYMEYLNEELLGITSIVFHIIVFSPLYMYYFRLRQNNVYYDMFLKMSLLSILTMVISTQLPILTRLSLLFAVSSCCFITEYFLIFKKNNINYCIVWSIIALYAFLKYYPSLSHINNYNFFINL